MLDLDWAGWTTWISLLGLDFNTFPRSPGASTIATTSLVNQTRQPDDQHRTP